LAGPAPARPPSASAGGSLLPGSATAAPRSPPSPRTSPSSHSTSSPLRLYTLGELTFSLVQFSGGRSRRLALLCLLMAMSLPAGAQNQNLAQRLGSPADAKLLIIHADDLAVAHSDGSSFAGSA